MGLYAELYCWPHIETIKVLSSVNTDTTTIKSARMIANNQGIKSELTCIGPHCTTLPKIITKREERDLELTNKFTVVNSVATSFNNMPEPVW